MYFSLNEPSRMCTERFVRNCRHCQVDALFPTGLLDCICEMPLTCNCRIQKMLHRPSDDGRVEIRRTRRVVHGEPSQDKARWIGLHCMRRDGIGWDGTGRVVRGTTRRLVVRRKSCNGSSEAKGNSLLTTS